MGKLLAFDIGERRTGIAESDPMKIIASPVGYVETSTLLDWLTSHLSNNEVETLVVGKPIRMHGVPSDVETFISELIVKVQSAHPNLSIEREDERFTSRMAQRAMIDGGMKKQKRKEKGMVDQISAVLILQSFMNRGPSF
ncbi:MAG: Holliday junction resolvase RuvX [Bacteroidetes bacterium]|uniref:Putative pre-16S rRNA nuclease n=1 Tax=Phaeocystidibacter marisrubri TaxID=1577780 RepID=A0A6L3ZI40_9FLAO|nr:Holliday junction resolvase RuvX [Phaeocystidibacter marisrubri]KAB2817279.1 Holliday junction resolvase RuvX [Phaeocystidibacter marisrubri]TNE27739.1 MAG: Holliday junction resolvase RuvX [Bacteroidota bacterium]GGH76122.1 putative pre-16S rRNA nuclease [Phaeocystidibacter marisrubri]